MSTIKMFYIQPSGERGGEGGGEEKRFWKKEKKKKKKQEKKKKAGEKTKQKHTRDSEEGKHTPKATTTSLLSLTTATVSHIHRHSQPPFLSTLPENASAVFLLYCTRN